MNILKNITIFGWTTLEYTTIGTLLIIKALWTLLEFIVMGILIIITSPILTILKTAKGRDLDTDGYSCIQDLVLKLL